MPDVKHYTGSQIAVVANSMAEARHELSVPEQRLVLWLVAQIEKADDCFQEHSLDVQVMEQILGSNNGRIYEQIRQVCHSIQKRVLEIQVPGEKKRKSFNWLHLVTYHDGEGRVSMRFHDELAPYLLRLREHFCQIPLVPVFRLRGGYSVRWLEMLCAKKFRGSWVMTVEELREWLHIEPTGLESVKDLRVKAIDTPKRELDQKSELTFTYEPHLIGRRITGWTFTVQSNKPGKKPLLPPPAPELFQRPSEESAKGFFEEVKARVGKGMYADAKRKKERAAQDGQAELTMS